MKRESGQLALKPSCLRFLGYLYPKIKQHLLETLIASTSLARELFLVRTSFYPKGGNLKEVVSGESILVKTKIHNEFRSQLNCFEKSIKESMSKKEKQNSEPMSDHQFYSIMIIAFVILIGFWLSKNEERIHHWIYVHFTQIGMCLYLSFVASLYLLRERLEKSLKKDRMFHLSKVWDKEDGVFVGTTKDRILIHLPDQTRTGHVQIIGATGRGKTESLILPMMVRDLRRGKSAVLIDGKGDRELADRIKRQSPNVNVVIFDLGDTKNSAITNPLKMGTAQQITDRIFAAFDFKDEYYRNLQYEITSVMVDLLHEQMEEVTFKKLYELFSSDEALSVRISKCKNEALVTRLVKWLSENRNNRDQNYSGITSQLGQFARGEVSCLINGRIDGKDLFSTGELLSNEDPTQFALVILIPTLLYQEMAFKLGKLFLQEVAWAVAARKEKRFTPIFLDEFSSFVYPGFLGILNKARSSGIALHLSHQSLGDLEMVSPEFANAINTNTNVKCLLGLNDPITADFFAKHLGTFTEEKVTERANQNGIFQFREMTGEMSVRDVEAYRIHPNSLKLFTRGKGVIQFHLPEGGDILEEVQFESLNTQEVI